MKLRNLPRWTTHRATLRFASLVFCLLAIALALQGEHVIREQHQAGVPLSTFWYAAGIATLILGILGTYRRRSMLAPRASPSTGIATLPSGQTDVNQNGGDAEAQPPVSAGAPISRQRKLPAIPQWRWLLTVLAVGGGVAAMQILRGDWMSLPGMILYLGSMALLVLAWVTKRVERPAHAPSWLRQFITLMPSPDTRPDADANAHAGAGADAETTTDWRLPLWVEAGFVGLVCVVALALRLYGLDNLAWGLHGDEGEVAYNAISILNGKLVSPFTTGWFAQPNVYYWSVALGLKIFGLSLFGLRMSSVIYSMLIFPFFYLLVRCTFGVRAAFLALGIFGANAVFLHYSRVQFSNVTTPVFWVIGFYLLFQGLRTRRMMYFVLSAFTSFFSLYFYNGARILPFMFVGLFVYLTLHWGFLRRYYKQLAVFAAASFVVSAPFLGYYLDHQQEMNSRSTEKLIYNNMVQMQAQYGDPVPISLPAGLAVTPSPQVYYFWRQLLTTLSMYTYRSTQSSIYGFTAEPVINFTESALLVLGIAMASWRWRDTRFAFLLIWFLAPTIAGGTLTIEAPYTDRVVGTFPTLPIFIALVVNKVAAEWVALWRSVWPHAAPWPTALRRSSVAASVAILAVFVLRLDAQNIGDLFGRYLPRHMPNMGLAQTMYVQQTGSSRKLYEIGTFRGLDFHNGSTWAIAQFVNADGRDLLNPGTEVPLQDINGKDVTLIINNEMLAYLNAIAAYYPGGKRESPNIEGIGQWFTFYTIPKEQIRAGQRVEVAYGNAQGTPGAPSSNEVTSQVAGIGTRYGPPPENASYPLPARWSGGLFAPNYTTYSFRLQAPGRSTLDIDGRTVLTASTAGVTEGKVILARGPHGFTLRATLPDAKQQVSLEWQTGNEPWSAPKGSYLWNGPLGGLLGELYPLQPNAVTTAPGADIGTWGVPLSRRVDGIFDWRSADGAQGSEGLVKGMAFTARWRGTFVAPTGGTYVFETAGDGGSGVWLDGEPAVLNAGPEPQVYGGKTGSIQLAAGKHAIEIHCNGGIFSPSQVDVYVTMPGKQKAIVNGTMFTPVQGVWLPGEIPDPPGANH